MNLQDYTPSHIESFLLNYDLLVHDLPEVVADWPNLDEEERSQHRADLLQVWGNRKVLGAIFEVQQLTRAQETRLAELDRLLLEQAARMEQCFGFDLSQLLAIFRWGTPLTNSSETVRLEVEPASLDSMASALTLSPVN